MVEDNVQNRMLLRQVFEFHGYEVIEAGDGEEGCRTARLEMPDLIVMDLQMPVMDGLTAIKALKSEEATRDIKIMAVTSFAMKADLEKTVEAGADYYMAKPLNIRELPEIVKRLINQ